MAVHVDPSLPIHPITVDDLAAMVDAGILGEDDRVELLDGVLVEMSPQGPPHFEAVVRLNELLVPVATAAGLKVRPQGPLDVESPISLPEPDLAVAPPGGWDRHGGGAVLVIEVSVSSRVVDLGRKAAVYAAAGIPEYWVLDMPNRRLIVHRQPSAQGYQQVEPVPDNGSVTATEIPFTVAVADLLPPA